MRRVSLFVVLVLALSLLATPSAPAQEEPRQPLMSANVQLLTTLPNPGVIGARFKGNVMYVTTATGLTTYDVENPAAPVELGRLPLPHFENEDVDLGGNILLISNDSAESTGILYVIDISNPEEPVVLSTLDMGGNPVEGGPGHTASCILGCKFAWVTDGGAMRVIDLRDPENPKDLGNFEIPTGGLASHDVQVDPNGIAWIAGFNGTAGYRIPASYDGPEDAKLVARTNFEAESTYDEEFGLGDGTNPNDFIHHNSLRRKNDDVLFITEEDYTRPLCEGAGSFQTWKLPTNKKGEPTGADLTPMDQWVTEVLRNPDATSDPAAAVCSAHYFDLRNNMVAQGWYEQGVRFLDVSTPGNIRQVGYFVPASSMTWAAYFAPTDPNLEIIYAFDATHGIDVLKVARPPQGALSAPHVACRSEACRDKNKMKARRAPILEEWKTVAPTIGLADERFGFACRLGLASALGQKQLKTR